MPETNVIKSRLQLKTDTEANWNRLAATNSSPGFIPLLGEIIIYAPDNIHSYSRMKIGNGSTNVVALPFIDAGTISGESLPPQLVEMYASRNAFPSPGQEGKLYVDLTNSAIYCYTNAGGFTQLSNIKYTINKTQVSAISSWSAGVAANALINEGILSIRNGIAPSLTYLQKDVVSELL